MVAAWIRAETGVGPSIASGSQTCRGTWADLPMAPPKMSTATAVSRPPERWPLSTASKVWPKPSVPRLKNTSRMPAKKKTSPTRVVMKAFSDARAAGVGGVAVNGADGVDEDHRPPHGDHEQHPRGQCVPRDAQRQRLLAQDEP